MAATGRAMRLCRCTCSVPSALFPRRPNPALLRTFSYTPKRPDSSEEHLPELDEALWAQAKGSAHRYLLLTLKGEDLAAYKASPYSPAEDRQLAAALARADADVENFDAEKRKLLKLASRDNGKLFWNDGEEDPALVMDELAEPDKWPEDEITTMGHAKLEEHREMRHYARIAAWEMPLLSSMFLPAVYLVIGY
jgi:small subunit ribosomal protein S35